MKLEELLSLAERNKDWLFKCGELTSPQKQIDISKIITRSQDATSNTIFVAVRGTQIDGHQFLPQVIQQGTKVIVVDRDVPEVLKFGTLCIRVQDSRRAFSILSSCFFKNPSKEIPVIGVTGTNGKTTTTYLMEQILTVGGSATGVMGTINHHLGTKVWETEHTTSDAFLVQSRLRDFREEGAKFCVMESTSHALDQSRIADVDFEGTIFTNLTQDHLDYHHTMENYFGAKQKLFCELLERSSRHNKFAVINRDDEWGKKLKVHSSARVFSYGVKGEEGRKGAVDVSFEVLDQGFFGQTLRIHSPSQSSTEVFEFQIKMTGLFNAYNFTAVWAAGIALGLKPKIIQQALTQFNGVPGRLERCGFQTDKFVFVDFAHTDDALLNTLRSLNEVRDQISAKKGPSPKIWTVFGCGGDRDRGKRPKMALVAEQNSDHVIVTSDNPRTEDPNQIIEEIKTGFTSFKKVQFEVDRRKAILLALSQANPEDVILIAGKGHETYQIIGTQKIHFDDREIVNSVQS